MSLAQEGKTTQRLSGLESQAFVQLPGSPAVFRLIQIHFSMHTRAHVLLQKATCTQWHAEGSSGIYWQQRQQFIL